MAAAAADIAPDRGYAEAIKALNSLQTPAKELAEQKRTGARDLTKAVMHVQGFAARVGITDTDLNRLNAVHVAGTKGKGSTCAMVEGVLRSRGHKTGLYTSPHLLEARERIRINSVPISRATFAKHFWECWDRLGSNPNTDPTSPDMPTYFRFLTLLAFRVFIAEQVDVAVVEVGLGGRHDATNILPRPVVTGVTALGLDHTAILGGTLTEIGYQKGGIFKAGVPAISSPQRDDGMAALRQCAADVGMPLLLAPPAMQCGDVVSGLAIKGEHQKENASLALQLARLWEEGVAAVGPVAAAAAAPGELVQVDGSPPSASTAAALQAVTWPGRSHKLEWNGWQLYLDGAHTAESAAACAGWFGAESLIDAAATGDENTFRVLIFNCTGGRNPSDILRPLSELPATSQIDAAIFCPGATAVARSNPDQINRTVEPDELLVCSRKNLESWEALHKGAAVPAEAYAFLEEAVERVAALRAERGSPTVHVLVTGSIHFVGAFLNFIEAEVR